MKDFLVNHFDTFITVAVTIVGFIVTILVTNLNFKKEITKSKISITTQEIISLPYELCEFVDTINLSEEGVARYRAILSKVIAYGSKDAVKIAVKMQQIAYSNKRANNNNNASVTSVAAISLLITQIKYDLTSEIISPDSWAKMRFPDYPNIKKLLISEINNLIDELRLKKVFKIT